MVILVKEVRVIGIKLEKFISENDDLPLLLFEAAVKQGTPMMDNDIIAITHTAVAKAEGLKIPLSQVNPTHKEKAIALLLRREYDPRVIALAVREAREIVRIDRGHLITSTYFGHVTANTGVDLSNVDGGNSAVILPRDPDEIAEKYRMRFKELGVTVAVIIMDSSGRPLRRGEVNIAIGVAGMSSIKDLRGKRDLYGRILKVKKIAVADEIAASAELVTGSCSEGIPAAIIRGVSFDPIDTPTGSLLVRDPQEDLFL